MRAFLSSAICSMKLFFRDPVTIIIMLVTPVVSMFILGIALDATFKDGFKLKDFNVAYIDNSRDANISSGFQQIVNALTKNDAKFTKISDETIGKKQVEEKVYSSLVILGNDSQIKLYKNGTNPLGGDILEAALKSFQDRVIAIKNMYAINPQRTSELLKTTAEIELVENVGVNGKNMPTSKEYYGIACIGMVLCFGVITVFLRVAKDMTSGGAKRKYASPSSPFAIYLGGLVGIFVAIVLQIIILCAYSIFINGSNWGGNVITIFLIFVTEAFMIVGIGGLIGCLIKNKNKIYTVNFIMIAIAWFLNLFAGNFAALSNYKFSESTMQLLRLSPILKVNDAALGLLYDADATLVAPCILTCLVIGFLCLGVSVIFYKRRVHP